MRRHGRNYTLIGDGDRKKRKTTEPHMTLDAALQMKKPDVVNPRVHQVK